jgi:hypothetical protein
LKGTTPEPAFPDNADLRARRQLRRVLLVLAAMDVGVLVIIVVLAVAAVLLHLTNLELLGLIVAGLGAIIGARVALAVRLRRRSGNL